MRLLGLSISLVSFVAVSAYLRGGELAMAPKPFPYLYWAGYLPITLDQSQGELKDGKKIATEIEKSVEQLLKSTQRFEWVSHQIVKKEWSSLEGRADLKNNKEVSCLLQLTMVPLGDTVSFILRILSPDLDLWLQEVESLSKSDMDIKVVVRSHLQALVYRLMNRLPMDVLITSVREKYVSFSVGENQNLKVGQIFNVFNVSLGEVHPVTGGWDNFVRAPAGKLKIIDVEEKTGIGELMEEKYQSAITVGSGFINEFAPTRAFFK